MGCIGALGGSVGCAKNCRTFCAGHGEKHRCTARQDAFMIEQGFNSTNKHGVVHFITCNGEDGIDARSAGSLMHSDSVFSGLICCWVVRGSGLLCDGDGEV